MHASAWTFDESESYPGEAYFTYLAHRFPVMCASDEFHFLPRAGRAAAHYDRLDDLDSHTITDVISQLKAFRASFEHASDKIKNIENYIDYKLLCSNSAGAIIEFEQNQAWRHNPLLYLKIAGIGIDHAFSKPAASDQARRERARARLAGVPRLLSQGEANLSLIPRSHYDASLNMVQDLRRYLMWLGQDGGSSALHPELEGALGALRDFKNFICTVGARPDNECAGQSLDTSLTEHFLARHSPDDIYRRAREAWFQNLEILDRLAAQINPGHSWQELYHGFIPDEGRGLDTLSLYDREIDHLRTFFSEHGFRPQDLKASLKLAETPLYLRSVRSSASFSAALTNNEEETSYFYIAVPEKHAEKTGGMRLQQRLHREYKYLTAHETIPGHHVLDSFRRRSKNPTRRQIESPLFYEGWATYVETLLSEQGYVSRPIERLVDHKRRLWRCARCMIDVGLATQRLAKAEAWDLLMQVGFSETESRSQVDRFQLNPGYQLCYFYGSSEILRLRQLYEKYHSGESFHTFMLEGGQLPFELIEQRILH